MPVSDSAPTRMKVTADPRVRRLVQVSARLDARRSQARGPMAWLRRSTRPVRLRMASISRALRRNGNDCAMANGPGQLKQFTTMWMLARSHGVAPADYYTYRLYRPEIQAVAGQFLDF